MLMRLQFAQYRPLLNIDKNLAALVRAVINTESRYVSQYPYCGAFQPPPESGLPPAYNSYATDVTVQPSVNCFSKSIPALKKCIVVLSITKLSTNARCDKSAL